MDWLIKIDALNSPSSSYNYATNAFDYLVIMTINENAQNLRQQYLKIIENVDRDSQSEVNLLLGIRTQLLEKFDSQRKKYRIIKK